MHYCVHCGLVDANQCTDFFPNDFPHEVNLLFLVCEHDVGANCTTNNTKGDELGTSTIAVEHVCVPSQLGEQNPSLGLSDPFCVLPQGPCSSF